MTPNVQHNGEIIMRGGSDGELYSCAATLWQRLRDAGLRSETVSAWASDGLLFMNGRDCRANLAIIRQRRLVA